MPFSTPSRDLVEACWAKKWDEAAYILGGEDYDILWQDAEKFTALHWAANHGDAFMTYTLLERGADPSVTNYMQSTPLMLACAGKHFSEERATAIRILISFGSPLPPNETPFLAGALLLARDLSLAHPTWMARMGPAPMPAWSVSLLSSPSASSALDSFRPSLTPPPRLPERRSSAQWAS